MYQPQNIFSVREKWNEADWAELKSSRKGVIEETGERWTICCHMLAGWGYFKVSAGQRSLQQKICNLNIRKYLEIICIKKQKAVNKFTYYSDKIVCPKTSVLTKRTEKHLTEFCVESSRLFLSNNTWKFLIHLGLLVTKENEFPPRFLPLSNNY